MDAFQYRHGALFAEAVGVENIAAAVGTPVYVYSQATFLDHLAKNQRAYADIDTLICYSVKACGNIHILRRLHEAGAGFDIVSGGELFRARRAGADPSRIVYAGAGKTDAEIIEALQAGIACFNIESEAELENLVRLTRLHNRPTRAALRVNPDIDPGTHRHITTGTRETKFGVQIEHAVDLFHRYRDNGAVDLCAIHVHLGSGGKTIDPYVRAVERALTLIEELRARGHRIEALNLGGGYGADYESKTVPTAADYAAGIAPLIKGRGLRLILEPGKSIIANAGILITRVLYTKTTGDKHFVIVDAGMNDLIRPVLYEAFHFIWPVRVGEGFVPTVRRQDLCPEGSRIVDVVGPICEGADFFARDRALPPVERGDLLAVFTAGAYGFTMASNYNARPMPPEVLVDGESFRVIRRRQTYEDLVAPEL
ncbi:MAG TPA: diaminopimelate decarboxylase [Phycisphaerales bacterium]|nr:diaminopimelate decarboxylase [Phycisphaerales bacterium]